MSVYSTSDHHLGQGSARTFYGRPFASFAEMKREWSIARIVCCPGDGDEVWRLGDFAVRQSMERVANFLATVQAGSTSSSATTTTPWSPNSAIWQSARQ
jgi:calcineurin-like phosphoesterase family protein